MNRTVAGTAQPSAPPIGLLLRKLDRLIDERFERTLSQHEVTRRQWQLMSTLAKGDATLDSLTAAVAPFLDQGVGETVAQHLDPLAARGIIRAEGEHRTLTDAGRSFFDRLLVDVQATRNLTVAGLPVGEYERTVTTLQSMIRNLEPEGLSI